MINEVMLKGLLERRSVRAFKHEQITDDELQAVLESGMYAPTAKGMQSPIIVAVQNPEEVAAVVELNKQFTENPNPYYGAPTILLVLVPRGTYLGTWDGSAVLTNLCNGAHAAGLGSVGKGGFFLTPEYGHRQRFGFLFTNLELEGDEVIEVDFRKDCDACIQGCPLKALSAEKGADLSICKQCRNGCKNHSEQSKKSKSHIGGEKR
jgi:hypothetical protein